MSPSLDSPARRVPPLDGHELGCARQAPHVDSPAGDLRAGPGVTGFEQREPIGSEETGFSIKGRHIHSGRPPRGGVKTL
jgi:hypothetical protein